MWQLQLKQEKEKTGYDSHSSGNVTLLFLKSSIFAILKNCFLKILIEVATKRKHSATSTSFAVHVFSQVAGMSFRALETSKKALNENK